MNKQILIVDDEKGIRDLMKYFLTPLGYTVSIACDGEEGVQLVKEHEYDVVFLDVHMPRMRGPEALKIIKQYRPQQLVVVFSSSSDPSFEFENSAKEQGAYECLFKPFDMEDIMHILERVK